MRNVMLTRMKSVLNKLNVLLEEDYEPLACANVGKEVSYVARCLERQIKEEEKGCPTTKKK